MNQNDLAAMATQALISVLGGAASTATSQLIQDRLNHSARGRAALDGLSASPSGPAAQQDVQAALTDEISGDGEFADRLALLLHASAQQTTGSVVITGSRLKHNQIALGPLTINNTPAGRMLLAAAIALALILLAFAAYGGVRLINTDDAPNSQTTTQHDASGSKPSVTASAASTATIRRMLPERSDMDAKLFPKAEAPELAPATHVPGCQAVPECHKATTAGVVTYDGVEGTGDSAEFVLFAFPDSASAHLAYSGLIVNSLHPNHPKVQLAKRGEESQFFEYREQTYYNSDGSPDTDIPPELLGRYVWFRQGPFVAVVQQLGGDTVLRGPARLLDMSATFADRIVKFQGR
ncbi:hypothetical protein [Streptomyces viridochromogenes]|uniref:hypothetical protein n=1 Tax=Streptomyces viridochromogenes TaxID=1938 RepID=UPI00069F6D30|nr:hypothetical protein [Streptomyces viridochromogenes]